MVNTFVTQVYAKAIGNEKFHLKIFFAAIQVNKTVVIWIPTKGVIAHIIPTKTPRAVYCGGCSERFKANAVEPIRYGRLILISHLKLISFFIKLAESLYNHKLFIKYLNYYAMIELLVLSSFFNGDVPHKRLKECSMIKSNLFYTCANSYIKHTYISLGMKIYNQFLYLQKKEDHSFVSHPITINVYHNLGVLNYLIDNVTLSEQIMYNALTLQNKTIKLIGHNEKMYKRNKFQLLKLLMFIAEIKIEKDAIKQHSRGLLI